MLKDVLVLHWGTVVAWLKASVASIVASQEVADYPYYGINAAEGQIQAVLIPSDKELVVTGVVTEHQRKGMPDDATLVLSFNEVAADGSPGGVMVSYAKEIGKTTSDRPGGERVLWELSVPFVILPEQPVFMVFTGNWTPSADGHLRILGRAGGYDGPYPRWMFQTETGWAAHPGDSLFFELLGYETDDPSFATNPDTTVVIAERIINPENLRVHLAGESGG